MTNDTDRNYRPPGSELIPDDGIIDELAVELCLAGDRRVRLTRTERAEAALRILDAGGDVAEIRYRLNLSQNVVTSLMPLVYARMGNRLGVAG